LLTAVGLPLSDEALCERTAGGQLAVVRGLQEFREHLGGELHITLIRGIGQSFEVTEMDEALVSDAISTLARGVTHPTRMSVGAAGGAA
jgi:3-dehydroquinate synthase